MSSEKTPPSLGVIAGTVIAFVFGQWAGFMVVYPIVFAFLAGWIASKTVRKESQVFIPAFAVQAGQMLWMILGAILLRTFSTVGLDVMLVGAGLVWLIVKPAKLPVIVLTLYHAFSAVRNVLKFLTLEAADTLRKPLAVHTVFEVTAIVLMWMALYPAAKKTSTAPPSQNDRLVLKYGFLAKAIAIGFLLFAIGIFIACVGGAPKFLAPWVVVIMALIVAIYILLDYTRVHYEYDSDAIYTFSPWRRDRVISWSSITGYYYSSWRYAWVIKTASDGMVIVSPLMPGAKALIDRVKFLQTFRSSAT